MSESTRSSGVVAAASAVARAVRAVAGVMGAFASAAIVVLMLVTVADVTRRSLQGGSIPGAYEYTEVILVGVAFAGMSLAEVHRAHVRTSILTDRLPPRVSAVARIVGLALGVAGLCWLTWITLQSGLEAKTRGESRMGLYRVPIWPARMLIPLGFGTLALQLLIELVDAVLFLRRGPGAARLEQPPDDDGVQQPHIDGPTDGLPL